jgi:Zn-dependent peptidase ImmA (M78 family)
LYKRIRIIKPSDLDEVKIARTFEIFIKRKPVPSSISYQSGRFKSITLNSDLPFEQQREDFYHELCHFLRHAGWQLMMPEAFRELQEWDARHFTRYAAIPYHMLEHFDYTDPDLITNMAETFKVTKELCVERLMKIKARYLHNQTLISEKWEHYEGETNR